MLKADLETWVLLGSSRGLGRAFFQHAQKLYPDLKFLLVARKVALLGELAGDSPNVRYIGADLSEPLGRTNLWKTLFSEVKPQRIFYFAGGGPYGPFQQKELKDHRWAIETSFLAPLELLHESLQESTRGYLKQVTVIGSAIAEAQPDPGSASYSAAKHGLKGLMSSLWEETRGQALDLRLYSPAYMDTDLLPPGATARQQAEPPESPQTVADSLLQWCLDPGADKHYKRRMNQEE